MKFHLTVGEIWSGTKYQTGKRAIKAWASSGDDRALDFKTEAEAEAMAERASNDLGFCVGVAEDIGFVL